MLGNCGSHVLNSLDIILLIFGVLCITLVAQLTKDKSKVKLALSIILGIISISLIAIVVWQMGIYNTCPPSTTWTDFKYIKPQGASLVLTYDGNFSGTFTNTLDQKIEVKAFRLKNDDDKLLCDKTLGEDVPIHGFIQIDTNGCEGDETGYAYSRKVEIDYSIKDSLKNDMLTEFGTIRGQMR
jgi:hypothetical protein